MLLPLIYDREADAIYIQLRDPHAGALTYAYGEDLDSSRRIDYAEDGQPIGVELLNVSAGVNVDDLPERANIEETLAARQFKVFA